MQRSVRTELAQKLDTVHTRHVEIEEYQAAVLWHQRATQHLESLEPVPRYIELIRKATAIERSTDVHYVDLIVLDQQDVEHALGLSVGGRIKCRRTGRDYHVTPPISWSLPRARGSRW